MTVWPTREGVALALFAVGALGVGLVGGNNGIVLVGAALASLWVVELALGSWNLRGVEAVRRLPAELFAEVSARGAIRLRNPRRWGPAYGLHVAEDGFDEAFAVAPVVPPGGSVDAPIAWRFEARGTGRLRRLRLTSRWPFGLVVRTRLVDSPAEILVWPPPRTGRAAEAPDPDPGDHDDGLRSGAWGELSRLRPYGVGDRARAIHWVTSARVGEPVVVARHDTATDAVRVRVARRTGRAWEDALSAACGEVVRAFRGGRAVGLDLPDASYEPRPGGAWRRVLLDTLARQPESR